MFPRAAWRGSNKDDDEKEEKEEERTTSKHTAPQSELDVLMIK